MPLVFAKISASQIIKAPHHVEPDQVDRLLSCQYKVWVSFDTQVKFRLGLLPLLGVVRLVSELLVLLRLPVLHPWE